MRQIIAHIQTQPMRLVSLIAVGQRHGAIAPAHALRATCQRAIRMNERVLGISFPMRGLASAADDDTSSAGFSSWRILARRGHVHQTSHTTEDTLRVID